MPESGRNGIQAVLEFIGRALNTKRVGRLPPRSKIGPGDRTLGRITDEDEKNLYWRFREMELEIETLVLERLDAEKRGRDTYPIDLKLRRLSARRNVLESLLTCSILEQFPATEDLVGMTDDWQAMARNTSRTKDSDSSEPDNTTPVIIN